MLSYNGKLDTPARQLYRHFIGEPPNPVERTCGIALCCNPWHLTRGVSYQEIRQQAFQELENARKAQLESAFHEPVSEDQEIEELAEMICEHWQRHPKAMLPQLTEHFGEDYDDETVRKATRWASLEMDGCPPVIRRELDVLLGITPEDRSR